MKKKARVYTSKSIYCPLATRGRQCPKLWQSLPQTMTVSPSKGRLLDGPKRTEKVHIGWVEGVKGKAGRQGPGRTILHRSNIS